MTTEKDKKIFDMSNSGKTDRYVFDFAVAVQNAVTLLKTTLENDLSPIISLNAFLLAWDVYMEMPEVTKRECKHLFDMFHEVWQDPALALVTRFLSQCSSIKKGSIDEYDNLCITCMEITEVLAHTEGDIPDSRLLYAEAMKLAEYSQKNHRHTAAALLYILCARISRWCFGESSKREVTLLRKGYQNHMMATGFDGIAYNTEIYACHISAASLSLVMNRKEDKMDMESYSMISESYRMLSRFSSKSVDFMRYQLFTNTGIRADVSFDSGEGPTCGYSNKKQVLN